MKYYFVENKSDDYGNCRREIVQTTAVNAKKYYWHKEIVDLDDIEVLKKYFDIVDYEEEKEREERFY